MPYSLKGKNVLITGGSRYVYTLPNARHIACLPVDYVIGVPRVAFSY